MHRIFVYGTLKRGFGNNCLLEGQKFVGEAVTKMSEFLLRSRGIPYVHRIGAGGNKIKGEVYEIDDNCLEHVDGLEGHPNWYRREEVELHDGSKAWIYIMPNIDYDSIPEKVKNGVQSWRE